MALNASHGGATAMRTAQPISHRGYFHEFDVSADGQRFLLIRTDAASRPVRLDLVLNWMDELKRLVPTR